jgi:hypothetical protein
MKFITTSNEVEQLRKDLNAALQCLSHIEQHDKETLLQANKDLQDENDNLVTEIQNVIEEAQDLHRLNGALQKTKKELVQERDALLDTINAHSHVSPTGGMTAKEVEEKIQQVRTEERSRIALLFGERRRWEESMKKLQSQKDGVEQDADRLLKILRGGESADSWLSTALRSSLLASLSIKQVKVKRTTTTRRSRRGSIDDNGFEAVRASAAAASKSTSNINNIITDTNSRPATLAGETSFRRESDMPDKSIVSRSCITKEQEDGNNEKELTDMLQDCSLANARESRRRSMYSKHSSLRNIAFGHLSDDEDLLDEQRFEEFCSTSAHMYTGEQHLL